MVPYFLRAFLVTTAPTPEADKHAGHDNKHEDEERKRLEWAKLADWLISAFAWLGLRKRKGKGICSEIHREARQDEPREKGQNVRPTPARTAKVTGGQARRTGHTGEDRKTRRRERRTGEQGREQEQH